MKFDITRIAIGKFGEVDDIDDDVAELLMEKAKKVWSNQYTNARVIDAGSLLGNAAFNVLKVSVFRVILVRIFQHSE